MTATVTQVRRAVEEAQHALVVIAAVHRTNAILDDHPSVAQIVSAAQSQERAVAYDAAADRLDEVLRICRA
jgi:hypothetical protein